MTERFPRVIDSSPDTCEGGEITLSLHRVAKPEFQRGRVRTGVQDYLLSGGAGYDTSSDPRVDLGVSGVYFTVFSSHKPSTLHKEGVQYSPVG